MLTDCKIRKVKTSDYKQFNNFCYEMYREKSLCFPLIYKSPSTVIYSKKEFLVEIESELVINLIALINDEIVGYIQADIQAERKTNGMKAYKYADIRNFYVKVKSNNSDIKKALYSGLEREARERGLDKIAVMNFGELSLDNFYLRQSFYPFSINYVKYLD